MILFFDTSALVKVFHEEKGSEVVTPLIKAKDNEVWISELARIDQTNQLTRLTRRTRWTRSTSSRTSGFA